MNFQVAANVTDQVIFELFDDIAPKTCLNFATLCEGYTKGFTREAIGYAGTDVQRVVKGMYVQAGNIGKVYGKLQTQYN